VCTHADGHACVSVLVGACSGARAQAYVGTRVGVCMSFSLAYTVTRLKQDPYIFVFLSLVTL
jgi:hypothetical protein